MANVKLVLKKSRQLFQERSYEQSLEELKPILDAENVNYNALVLAAACYDQLHNEDKAVDTAYLALKSDSSNPVAWQGLLQFCLKNTDRFYALGLQCCVFLLSHYAKDGAPQKRLECVKNFIRLLVFYRLELPDNTPPLTSLCMLTLASDSENAYALEAAIRLLVESALFSVTDSNANQETNPQRNPTFDSFAANFTGISRPDLHLLETYTSRLRNIVHTHPSTPTAKATASVGEACVAIVTALFGPESETRVQHKKTEEEKEEAVGRLESPTMLASLQAASKLLSPFLPVESWQRQGYLDIHACALAAVTAHALRDFSRCDHITKEIMSFCRAHIMSVSKEVESLNSLADSQPSTRTDFLTRRLPVTPIRMEAAGGVRGLYRVCDWAGCLLLSNAALSTLGSLASSAIDSFSSNCLTESLLLAWPSPQAITFAQCCLLSADAQSLKKVTFQDTDCPQALNEVALRGRLVRVWLSLLQKQPAYGDNLRELLSLNAAGEGFSTGNRYLTGWLILKAASATEEANASAREVALNNFYCGIREDKLYFPNYLYAGHLFKDKSDYRRALTLYGRAWTLMPGHPEIAYALSVAFCKLGKPEDAYKVYKNVNKKTFTTAMWLNYGLICLHLDKLLECVPALQKVVMAEPANALYWELLGDAYMARGSYRTALQSFGKSMQISKDSPMIHIQHARANIALSEYSSAVDSLQYALDLVDRKPNLPLLILAAKGLMEVNIVLALQDLKQGLRTTGLEYIESALHYAARVLKGVQAAGVQPPNWLWYYMGFSLSFLIGINDSTLDIKVPAVIASFHQAFAVEAGKSDGTCSVSLAGCIDLAQIFLAILVRQTVPGCAEGHGDTQPAAITPEGSLACICLGMLSLFRAGAVCPRRQSGNLASSRLPLDRSLANTVEGRCTGRHLAIAETWFQRALGSKTTPTSNGLLSLAWFGLGAVYSFTRDSLVEQSAYCLCKALTLCNSLLSAGAALSFQLLALKQVEDSRHVLDICQTVDSGHLGCWLAMSAAPSAQTSPMQPGVLRCLLQASCFGFSVDLVGRLIPKVFESFLSTPITTLQGAAAEELRLSLLVSAEYLNRSLAFFPNDYRLWHDRGLLLQLTGLVQPAHFCFKRALDLCCEWGSSNENVNKGALTVAKTHYFLSTFIRKKPNWTIAEEVVASVDSSSDCHSSTGIHLVRALVALRKHDFKLAKKEFDLSLRLASNRVSARSALTCFAAALLRVGVGVESKQQIPAFTAAVASTAKDLASAGDDTSKIGCCPDLNSVRCHLLASGLELASGTHPIGSCALTSCHLSVTDASTFQYPFSSELLHALSYFSRNSDLQMVTSSIKTRILLFPNDHLSWTLLATALRLNQNKSIQKTPQKGKRTSKAHPTVALVFHCLMAACAVSALQPSYFLASELTALVHLCSEADESVEHQCVASLRPFLLRAALRFPHVPNILPALERVMMQGQA
nr:unnamed protein product [Spirometra erinaceieuropaei]